jgi:hypothetical protein
MRDFAVYIKRWQMMAIVTLKVKKLNIKEVVLWQKERRSRLINYAVLPVE